MKSDTRFVYPIVVFDRKAIPKLRAKGYRGDIVEVRRHYQLTRESLRFYRLGYLADTYIDRGQS